MVLLLSLVLEKVYSLAKDYTLISHASKDRILFDILLLALPSVPKLLKEDSFNEILKFVFSICAQFFIKMSITIIFAPM